MTGTSSDERNDGTPQRQTVLDVGRHIAPEPRVHYISYPFEVPEGASKVGLIFSFYKEYLAQLFISLHGPGGFRGNRMNPGARGDVVLELWVAPDDASEGGIAGSLPAGTWTAQLDIERLGEETEYRLEAYVEQGPIPEVAAWTYPAQHVVREGPDWYKGELHAHSTESDGKFPVVEVVEEAINVGLDFFALTDHFTVSQWRKLAPLANDRMAILRSCEVTSHQGHANLHGIAEWVDVYVDRDDWSMDQVAEEVHRQGGLFCVNHPFSGDLGWRAYDFDWSKADLMEVYHNLEGANNASQVPLWDHHLRQGRSIIGVGGIDSHNPYHGTHKLGQLVTWVDAPELSERGILEGLRRGNVYVSRGPEMRFSADDAEGNRAVMWEALPLGHGETTFRVDVRTDEPVRVFVFKNGYPFETFFIEEGADEWQTISLRDGPSDRAYYRVELHAFFRHERYPGIQWRDFETMRAISNPIWIGGIGPVNG